MPTESPWALTLNRPTISQKGTTMSADNGYILRKRDDGKLVLQMYFASADEYPPIDSPKAKTFKTVLEALDYYEEHQDEDLWSEYGLTIKVK